MLYSCRPTHTATVGVKGLPLCCLSNSRASFLSCVFQVVFKSSFKTMMSTHVHVRVMSLVCVCVCATRPSFSGPLFTVDDVCWQRHSCWNIGRSPAPGPAAVSANTRRCNQFTVFVRDNIQRKTVRPRVTRSARNKLANLWNARSVFFVYRSICFSTRLDEIHFQNPTCTVYRSKSFSGTN